MRKLIFVAVAAAATVVLTVPGAAIGLGGSVPAPPAVPTSADQIQNIDQVKTAIKGYYGDMVTSDVDPVPNTGPPLGNDPNGDGGDTPLHTFSPTSPYANEMAGIVNDAEKYLKKPNPGGNKPSNRGTKAVVFDVDDTTLTTYSYEVYSNWVYKPTTNADFVNAAVFPAAPHMVDLEHYAENQGYTVFFLTGRPESQRAGTETNLTNVGYDVDSSRLFLKDYTVDTWLSPCAPSCSTIEYKSLTRAHIESMGYDIVANFGDQYSDLTGGYANKTFKLPNPSYYLP
jgi:HAD superfamily, subfamily IIIB (Acid phosphatase)